MVAGARVAGGREDDAALLAAASSPLGRGDNGGKQPGGGKAVNRTKCLCRPPAQCDSVRGERPKHEFPHKRSPELRSDGFEELRHYLNPSQCKIDKCREWEFAQSLRLKG
jgi:hypothetical protein